MIDLQAPVYQNVPFPDGRTAGHIASHETPDDFSFLDFIDMINPLQHIPVINHAYRKLTGDEIKPISAVIGGAVYGGPLGAANGVVNMIVAEETGRDIMSHMFEEPGEPKRVQQVYQSYDVSVSESLKFTHGAQQRYNA